MQTCFFKIIEFFIKENLMEVFATLVVLDIGIALWPLARGMLSVSLSI